MANDSEQLSFISPLFKFCIMVQQVSLLLFTLFIYLLWYRGSICSVFGPLMPQINHVSFTGIFFLFVLLCVMILFVYCKNPCWLHGKANEGVHWHTGAMHTERLLKPINKSCVIIWPEGTEYRVKEFGFWQQEEYCCAKYICESKDHSDLLAS